MDTSSIFHAFVEAFWKINPRVLNQLCFNRSGGSKRETRIFLLQSIGSDKSLVLSLTNKQKLILTMRGNLNKLREKWSATANFTNTSQRSSSGPSTVAALPSYLALSLDPKHVWWLGLSFRGSPWQLCHLWQGYPNFLKIVRNLYWSWTSRPEKYRYMIPSYESYCIMYGILSSRSFTAWHVMHAVYCLEEAFAS